MLEFIIVDSPELIFTLHCEYSKGENPTRWEPGYPETLEIVDVEINKGTVLDLMSNYSLSDLERLAWEKLEIEKGAWEESKYGL